MAASGVRGPGVLPAPDSPFPAELALRNVVGRSSKSALPRSASTVVKTATVVATEMPAVTIVVASEGPAAAGVFPPGPSSRPFRQW